MGGTRFEFSRTASPDAVAEWLTSIAHGLKRGEVSFKSAGLALRFVPSTRVVVEVWVTEKERRGTIALRIGWTEKRKSAAAPHISVRPRAVRGAPSPHAPRPRSLPPGPTTRPGAVLVIEGEEHPRRMLVDALVAAGHTAEGAANGLEGLAKFRRGAFDVIITARSIPECSGLDVVRAVKKMSPTTPVIMTTGWGDLLSPEQMGGSGVDFILVKPFRSARVLSVLADALALRRSC